MSITYEPTAGRNVTSEITVAIKMAEVSNDIVTLKFNGTEIEVYPTYASHLYAMYART